MTNKALKTITIVSAAGSGNVFAQHLIRSNLMVNIRWVYHDLNQADKNGINLVFIRSPYENVASGLEIILSSMSKEKKDLVVSRPRAIQNKVEDTLETYQRYINHSKKFDYITPVTFDLLTKNPDRFLKYISKKFDIPYTAKHFSGDSVKAHINSLEIDANRLPREKSDLRKAIDEVVYKNDKIAEEYQDYIKYRDVLQLTENML
jgi:hypothetical protein